MWKGKVSLGQIHTPPNSVWRHLLCYSCSLPEVHWVKPRAVPVHVEDTVRIASHWWRHFLCFQRLDLTNSMRKYLDTVINFQSRNPGTSVTSIHKCWIWFRIGRRIFLGSFYRNEKRKLAWVPHPKASFQVFDFYLSFLLLILNLYIHRARACTCVCDHVSVLFLVVCVRGQAFKDISHFLLCGSSSRERTQIPRPGHKCFYYEPNHWPRYVL